MPRRASSSLPRGLPASTNDLLTIGGIQAERLDLEALRRAGRIDAYALAAGIYALELMLAGLERRQRLRRRRR